MSLAARIKTQRTVHRACKTLVGAAALAAQLGCPASSQPGTQVGFDVQLTPATVAISPGGTGIVHVAITRQANFGGAVEATVASPAFISGTVTIPAGQSAADMTVLASISAPIGSTPLRIASASDGYATVNTVIQVSVTVAGSFSIVPSDNIGTSRQVARGQVFDVAVAVDRNQFAPAITLSIDQQPGFSGVVTQQPGTGNAGVIRITVANNAPIAQPTTLVVTGTAGSTTSTAQIAYTVRAPTYTLSVSPSPLTVAQGANASITITATRESGMTADIALTGTSTNAGITVTPATLSANPVTMQVNVASSVPGGQSYPVVIHGNTFGLTEVVTTLNVAVQQGDAGYTLAVQTAPLNITAQTAPASDNVQINRTTFAGAVTVQAPSDDPHLQISVSPNSATTGNAVSLSVSAGQAVRLGTHSITVSGTSSTFPVQTTFAVVVGMPTGGAPVGIVILPDSQSAQFSFVPRLGTKTYTAYLVDAQGNRTLPASGWDIGFAVQDSNAGDVILPIPAFDAAQRWRVATVVAKTTPNISSSVTAYYFNTATGTSTFAASSVFQVGQ